MEHFPRLLGSRVEPAPVCGRPGWPFWGADKSTRWWQCWSQLWLLFINTRCDCRCEYHCLLYCYFVFPINGNHQNSGYGHHWLIGISRAGQPSCSVSAGDLKEAARSGARYWGLLNRPWSDWHESRHGELEPPYLGSFRLLSKRQETSRNVNMKLYERAGHCPSCSARESPIWWGSDFYTPPSWPCVVQNWTHWQGFCTYKRGQPTIHHQSTLCPLPEFCLMMCLWGGVSDRQEQCDHENSERGEESSFPEFPPHLLLWSVLALGWCVYFEHAVLIVAAGLDQASWKARAFADVPPCAACWRERCILWL